MNTKKKPECMIEYEFLYENLVLWFWGGNGIETKDNHIKLFQNKFIVRQVIFTHKNTEEDDLKLWPYLACRCCSALTKTSFGLMCLLLYFHAFIQSLRLASSLSLSLPSLYWFLILLRIFLSWMSSLSKHFSCIIVK